MPFLQNRRILLAIIIILALSLIVVLYAVRQRQDQRSKASQATTLYFTPITTTPLQKNVNDTFSLDLMVNPGVNLVSFVKVLITYDASKFDIVPNGLVANTTAFPVTAEGPTFSPGLVAASYTIGTDPAKAINVPTKVATLTLKAKASTNGSATSIGFDPQTQILSVAPTDQANENVLSSTTPALIIINQLAICPANPGIGDIMMIVDVSGSTLDNRASQKTAMKTFVDNVAATATNPPLYAIGLVSYASVPKLNFSLQNGTDYTSLKSAIDTMPFIDNASAGEDEAITMASQQLHNFGRAGIRKIIVILTDRIDSYAQDAANADYALNHTAYYVIAYDISNSTIRRNLQSLATNTGGTYHEYTKSGGPTENQILTDVAGQVSCPQTTPAATAAPTGAPTAMPTATPIPTATPVPAPTLTFTGNPLSIAYNAVSTLTWSTTNTTSCVASGAWTGTKTTSGSASSGQLTTTKTFTLTCSGTGGNVAKSVTISVAAAPTNTPTPTIKILPTATGIPTPTAVPTVTSVPTNTPVPNNTRIALSFELHGIGISGDNQNPNPAPCQKATFSATDCLSNQNPVHPQRQIDVTVFTNATNQISKTATLTYDTVSGLFKSTVDLGTSFLTDDYSVYVHTGKYLSKIISGQHITQGTTTPILKTALVTGDANGDNAQSILDYTLLMGCYATPQTPAKACDAEKAAATDFNDDGVTNQYDYNLFLRDLITHNGDQLPF